MRSCTGGGRRKGAAWIGDEVTAPAAVTLHLHAWHAAAALRSGGSVILAHEHERARASFLRQSIMNSRQTSESINERYNRDSSSLQVARSQHGTICSTA
eukprot:6192131-Pleurochrysis_carterae.AAC.1